VQVIGGESLEQGPPSRLRPKGVCRPQFDGAPDWATGVLGQDYLYSEEEGSCGWQASD
jgi:hypothetical protein